MPTVPGRDRLQTFGYHSDEQVLSRWANPLGRYPPYVKEVDRALASGE